MFPLVPLTREPTRTLALDPGASGSALIPADTSLPSRDSGHFPDFPWPGSPWLAHGSSLHGDWFPSPTGLLLGVCCPISPVPLLSPPRDVPFPSATSRHWPRPHTSPLIPCLYPTGPPAMPWRAPTGSSFIRGPFRASCTGRPYPAPLCLGGLIPTGHFGDPSSWPRPRFRSHYPCLYPTGPPASYVYTPPCRLQPCGACRQLHFLPLAPIASIPSPAACSLSAVCPLAVH